MAEPRIVYGRAGLRDFTARWRAKVHPSRSTWLRRRGFRYQLWQEWVGEWHPRITSKWYPTREKALAAADTALDRIESWDSHGEDVTHV